MSNPQKPQVMVGISVRKDARPAVETLEAIKRRPQTEDGRHYEFAVGLECEARREDMLAADYGPDFIEAIREQKWKGLYLWDEELNKKALAVFDCALGRPIYEGFSYGAAVNRLMLLAIAAGAKYLVRFDPGTGVSCLDELVKHHIATMERTGAKVVSGQYSRRLALRTDFIIVRRIERYLELVRKFTGINPRRGKQVTGGAGFTVAPDGPPAMPFQGARVWGSDDGYFKTECPGQALVQTRIEVLRAKPGVSMEVKDYVARVANMVALHELSRTGNKERALRKARSFAEGLVPLVKAGTDFSPQAVMDSREFQIAKLRPGLDNYASLNENWAAVIRAFRASALVNQARIFQEGG